MMTIEYLGSADFGVWLSQCAPEIHRREWQAVSAAESLSPGGVLVMEGTQKAPDVEFDLVIRVLAADDEFQVQDLETTRISEVIVIRGACEEVQLRSALNQGARFVAASELRSAVTGPYAHDLRGTLGVLTLTRQLVAATGGNEMVAKKLTACSTRLSAHIDDLCQLTPLYLGSDSANESLDVQSWATAVSSLREWWEAMHRGTELKVVPESWPEARAPAQAMSLLRAVVDAVVRFGEDGAPVEISLTTLEGGGGLFTASRELPLGQLGGSSAADVFSAQPDREGRRKLPYRLRACEEWAAQNHATMTVNATGEMFRIALEWPAGGVG